MAPKWWCNPFVPLVAFIGSVLRHGITLYLADLDSGGDCERRATKENAGTAPISFAWVPLPHFACRVAAIDALGVGPRITTSAASPSPSFRPSHAAQTSLRSHNGPWSRARDIARSTPEPDRVARKSPPYPLPLQPDQSPSCVKSA